VYEAIERIRKPQPIDANIMLGTAIIGVLVNIVLGVVLGHGHDHSHGHGDAEHGHSHAENSHADHAEHDHAGHTHESGHSHASHDYATTKHKKEANPLLSSAWIHVIGDLISSVGVVIAAIIIKFKPNLLIVDPICTFIFSVIVLFTTFKLVGKSVAVLMEATPSHIDPLEIEEDLAKVPGVRAVHGTLPIIHS